MNLIKTHSDFGPTTDQQTRIHSITQDKDKDEDEDENCSFGLLEYHERMDKITRSALSYWNNPLSYWNNHEFEGPTIQDSTNFTPRFRMTRIIPQHLPDIKDDDEPIQWRRIRLKPIECSPPISGGDQNAIIESKPNYSYSIPYTPKIDRINMFFNQIKYSSDLEKIVNKIMKEYYNNQTLSRTEKRLCLTKGLD